MEDNPISTLESELRVYYKKYIKVAAATLFCAVAAEACTFMIDEKAPVFTFLLHSTALVSVLFSHSVTHVVGKLSGTMKTLNLVKDILPLLERKRFIQAIIKEDLRFISPEDKVLLRAKVLGDDNN